MGTPIRFPVLPLRGQDIFFRRKLEMFSMQQKIPLDTLHIDVTHLFVACVGPARTCEATGEVKE